MSERGSKTKALKRRGRAKPLDRRASKGGRGTLRMLEAILRIHQLLKPGNAVSTQTLQDELETSRSTVQRLIRFMRDRLGADIETNYDEGGYRYFGKPVCLPEPMLTEGDLIALYIAAPILEQYRGTDLGAQFEASFHKIFSLLPERTQNRMFVPRRIEVKASVPAKDYADRFTIVLNAIHRGHQLDMIYATASRPGTHARIVDPYTLCVVDSKWYLLAYDHLRKQILKFAIERIWTVKELNREFDRPVGFSAAEHLRDSFGIYQPPKDSGEVETEIRIKFDALSARYVRETQWHRTQQIKDLSDRGLELTIKVRGTLEVERFVLAWGEHAEVLAPFALRERMRERLSKALASYGDKNP